MGFNKIVAVFIFIIKTSLKKFIEYLLILIDVFKEDRIAINKSKNIKKNLKSNSWNFDQVKKLKFTKVQI